MSTAAPITLFLAGDVMTGRGIDQILPHPNHPVLHEAYVTSALDYVKLAERENGPIAKPVDFAYLWGDVLPELARRSPDLRIVNLETAVTRGGEPWPNKGIHYRMHPGNMPCLTAADITCCVLANNHVLDWGYTGLDETLMALRAAGIRVAGAGHDLAEAEAPAELTVPGKGRTLVFAFGHGSSGIPREWKAAPERPGLNRLRDFSEDTVTRIAERVRAAKRPGDLAVASIHWGGNWGYEVPERHQSFAHRLIDAAHIDLVHGHSSHHPLGLEVYRDKLILYGCGDFVNDYEGIRGYEEFRGDLTLAYFPVLDPASGNLRQLHMVPFQVKRFRLHRASPADVLWLAKILDRASQRFGSTIELDPDHTLRLRWKSTWAVPPG